MACLARANETKHTPMVKAQRTNLTELGWLSDLCESRQPLDELRPIWVRDGIVDSGPAIPHPEHHPYCEFGTHMEGEELLFVEGEQSRRQPGDLLLAGPGVPHWAKITRYPVQFVTIYFLPSVLIALRPEQDGARMLRRFTAPQTLSGRLVRPPPDLRRKFVRDFKEMVVEFERQQFGTEVRLRMILVEMLVRLLRWEQSQVHNPMETEVDVDWQILSRVLQYLRTRYAESIYARDVAAAAGVCESRLEAMFRKALGISWVHFLRSYRIERAAALLNDPHYRVIDAAMAVGFESLSNFNITFRNIMSLSPTAYQKKVRQQAVHAQASTRTVKELPEDQSGRAIFANPQSTGGTFHSIKPPNKEGPKGERQHLVTFEEDSLRGSTLHRVDMSHAQMIDCNIEGMTINGVLVSEMIDAYQKTKTRG
ncbi:MAG: AraC family transcriptional regulator [Candidatus Omnitrophica bacterium]|nr:AraC family transcriptional regulator [Candidatus Omnitrophota bacterium]